MPTCPECHVGYPTGTSACPRDGATLTDDDGDEAGGGAATLPWSAPQPVGAEVSDPLVGSTVAGRFKVTARIGHGGMGIVYRATHAVIGRELALKVLHERHVDRPEVAARLMNEARLASAIRNEHIVDIFDFGETPDGRTFVVMELLSGESLAAVIRREGALPEARALAICLQVSDALGAAHERGIIHRDVKPENIFLSRRDGEDFVKVVDFGISKAIRGGDLDEESARLTHTGMVLGTPLYMSPEQARGEEQIDHRIDIYALGVILYECLTGEVPFRGSNYLGVISDVLSRVPPSLRTVRPDLGISAAVEQVVARAMSRDREARYASMADFATDLRHVIAGEPLLPVAAVAAAAPPRARERKALMYAAMVAIALVATITTVLLGGRSPAAPRVDAPVAATPPPASVPAPPPPPSATVDVHFDKLPPGTEIWNGARKLGVAPQTITLARSDKPLHLIFRLDGHEDGETDLVPAIDGDSVEVKLMAKAPPAVAAPARKPSHRRATAAKSNVQEMPPAVWPGSKGTSAARQH